jgi:Ca2+-binding EF-hand superfamily protein
MDDNILRMYIDEVFSAYDSDRSGSLDKRELVGFFNRLFQSFNDPRRIDQNTINQILTQSDMNHDGQISKP